MQQQHHAGQWPALNFGLYSATITTVQLWTQIVGKIRLVKMPWLNHSWHVSFYVSSRGLTTGSIPYEKGNFQLEFDFINHQLVITSSAGIHESIDLAGGPVSSFYHELFSKLSSFGIEAHIYARPNEIEPAIPFAEDDEDRVYDSEQMHNLWQVMVRVDTVFNRFRAGYTGKCSPVHFFWGGFDLTVTRFSGRKAPLHPGGGVPNMPIAVMQEAYSHEECSAGFWPGGVASPHPVFYSYLYPAAPGYSTTRVEPAEAFYSDKMGEFFLPYEVVQQAADPEMYLVTFLESTYEAAAVSANWDRENLEFHNPFK